MGGILSPVSGGGGLTLQAATPLAGYQLVNGTPNIIGWTPPNDGKLHRFQVFCTKTVQSLETGGYIQVTFQSPDGTASAYTIMAGSQGTGYSTSETSYPMICQGGFPVIVRQFSALTVGASTFWAEIWGT